MYCIIIFEKLNRDRGYNGNFIFNMLFSGTEGMKIGQRYRRYLFLSIIVW
jgi:hypothetical protein